MNILTFDIEDWYNCDYLSQDFDWDKWEYRVDKALLPLLEELDIRGLKGTFFCLGWLAEKHPDIIREIDKRGHQIGCHSYQHQLLFRLNPEQFIEDTMKSKLYLEKIIGKTIYAFRAPGFSITRNNLWVIDKLVEMGFMYDCSVFPAYHDCGGMPRCGVYGPAILKTKAGNMIKEFPVNIHSVAGMKFAFSGGGFFRILPYWLIKKWGRESEYMMTYFHPREFDVEQPRVKGLSLKQKLKSYVGIKGNMKKWKSLLDDFEFVNVLTADKLIDWDKTRIMVL